MKPLIEAGPHSQPLQDIKCPIYFSPQDILRVPKKTKKSKFGYSPVLRNRSCQTSYRETDAQTVPWFPPYTTNESKTPEVVTFASLPFENTCLERHDVEIVQRRRKMQEWDKYLATIPPQNIDLRRKIIMKIEQDKWNFRQKELDEENEKRMEEARKEMEEQQAIVQERVAWRTKQVQEKWEKSKNISLPKIKTRLDRDLRRINFRLNRPRYPDKPRTNEVIDQYYSGELNFPPARYGRDPKRTCEVLCKAAYPTTMKDAYLMLEKTLETPRKYSLGNKKITKHNCDRHKSDLQPAENQKHPCLTKNTSEERSKPNIDIFESTIKEEITAKPEEDEQFQRDIKLIQYLLRGRAVQNMMIRQYKANLGLLAEMGASLPLNKDNEETLEKSRLSIVEGIRDYNLSIKMKDKIHSVIGRLEGHTVSATLDFSSKELMRLEEQRRLYTLAETAEKERWAREAVEGGRRQEELQRQRQHEEIYKEVMKTHELTSDALMGEILDEQIDDTGKSLATIWTRKAADIYDTVIPKPCSDEYKKLEYVSLLADRCLVTQSENKCLKEQKNQKDVKFKKTANDVLYALKNDLDKQYSTESFETFESVDSAEQNKSESQSEHILKKIQVERKHFRSDSDEKLHAKATPPGPQQEEFAQNEQNVKFDRGVLHLMVEKDDSSEIILKNYELDNINEKIVRKFLEYEYRKECSESEHEDNDLLISAAAGDPKAVRKQLFQKEKELLKKFVDKPSLLFEKSDAYSDYSEPSEKETDISADMDHLRISSRKEQRKPSAKETEEMFQQKCLERKADRILNEVLTIAEDYIEKYQSASKKDGYSLELLQQSYADVMTDAYRILSIALLSSSEKKSKTALEKNIKPWVNTILNEVTKRVRKMFSSLAVEECEEEIAEEVDTENQDEEEYLEPEDIDNIIIDTTTPQRLTDIQEAIPADHIFSNKKFYWCPDEGESESPEEIQTEAESDLDDGKPIKYLGVLDEKATENLIPEEKLLKKWPSVIKHRPLERKN